MKSSEEVPLWNSVTDPVANALEFAFGCRYRKLGRVFTIDNRRHRVCCECGATFNYWLEAMSIRRHRGLLPALLHLQLHPWKLLRRVRRVL